MQHGGQHYIVPFLINSGAVDSFRPIVVPQMLSLILGRPVDAAASVNQANSQDELVTLPTPLGDLRDFSAWGQEEGGQQVDAAIDLRCNVIGHGFANFIDDVRREALKVRDGRLSFETALEYVISDCPTEKRLRDYIQDPANRPFVQRELSACIEAMKDDDVPLDKLAERWALECT